MSWSSAIPLWAYFVLLGVAFVSAHFLAYRPSPSLSRGRRQAGRWGSSLLFLCALLLVSREVIATVLPALLLAALGGVVSGRTAPAPPSKDG